MQNSRSCLNYKTGSTCGAYQTFSISGSANRQHLPELIKLFQFLVLQTGSTSGAYLNNLELKITAIAA